MSKSLVAAFERATVERFAAERAHGPATHLVSWVRLDTPRGMGPVSVSARVPEAALELVLEALFAAAKNASCTCIEYRLLSDTTARVAADVEDKLRQLRGGA